VAIRQPSGRAGLLTAAPLSGGAAAATIDNPGSGAQIVSPASSLLLQGVGGMATTSAGATFSSADRGETAGLMAAPCTAPATSQWLVGLGADETHRSDLVLSNPDDAQAEVDLRFYGRTGLLVVPGSSGLVVPAHASRTISLPALVGRGGPLGVWVRASSGRVAAIGRDLYSVGLDPAGADWHQASAPPGTDLVIPGVPDGQGSRDLVVTNPGTDRATVTVSVLGASGSFSPAGAAEVVVEPESTASVSVAAGLTGQAAGVALLSDRPVTAAVLSTSQAADPATGSAERPDLAVQPAAPTLGGTGVSAIATAPGVDSELVLSNGSGTDAAVSFSVLSLAGVELHRGDMLVPAHATSIRRLTSAPPSYLVLDLPDGPKLYGTVRLASTSGPVGGLASLQITSPDLAFRVRSAVPDPTVGR
jgi:hypothetical protein